MILQDSDPMPIKGEFKNVLLGQVPDSYLKTFWNQNEEDFKNNKFNEGSEVFKLMKYIENNLPAIESNLKNS